MDKEGTKDKEPLGNHEQGPLRVSIVLIMRRRETKIPGEDQEDQGCV